MDVASNEGGYQFRDVLVRPTNGGRNPLRRACLSVDTAGENNAA